MQSNDLYTLTNNFVKVFEGWALWIAVAAGGVIGLHRAYKKLREYFLQDNFITIEEESLYLCNAFNNNNIGHACSVILNIFERQMYLNKRVIQSPKGI